MYDIYDICYILYFCLHIQTCSDIYVRIQHLLVPFPICPHLSNWWETASFVVAGNQSINPNSYTRNSWHTIKGAENKRMTQHIIPDHTKNAWSPEEETGHPVRKIPKLSSEAKKPTRHKNATKKYDELRRELQSTVVYTKYINNYLLFMFRLMQHFRANFVLLLLLLQLLCTLCTFLPIIKMVSYGRTKWQNTGTINNLCHKRGQERTREDGTVMTKKIIVCSKQKNRTETNIAKRRKTKTNECHTRNIPTGLPTPRNSRVHHMIRYWTW